MVLTQEIVREWFTYEEGFLYYKKRRGSNGEIGNRAGSPDKSGRKQIKFFNVLYKSSRLIFLYHKGYLPEEVDHKNRDCTDDKIEETLHTHKICLINVLIKIHLLNIKECH